MVRKTHVMKKTLDPEWGEQFDFHGTLGPLPLLLSLKKAGLGSEAIIAPNTRMECG